MTAQPGESALGRLERFFETALERPFRELFGSRLQPVELAKAAERAMRRSQVVGPRGLTVANRYAICLHQDDLESISSFKAALQREVLMYLEARAKELGLRPVDRWQVEVASATGVRRGSVRVDAQFLDNAQWDAARSEHTGRMSVSELRQKPLRAALVDRSGKRQFELTKRVVAIGRALDNDLVLADESVSRYHAQIRQESDLYVLTDLASTNGTLVSGQRVSEAALTDGADLAFGRSAMTFVVLGPPGPGE